MCGTQLIVKDYLLSEGRLRMSVAEMVMRSNCR